LLYLCYNDKMRLQVGAEISFRQEDINRLFCKSTIHVTYILIANNIATALAKVKSFFAPSFAFAPIAA
jgi:hypothetical protein